MGGMWSQDVLTVQRTAQIRRGSLCWLVDEPGYGQQDSFKCNAVICSAQNMCSVLNS